MPENRLTINANYGAALAQYKDIKSYVPEIGDFIIWHGWWGRWYGVISEIKGDGLLAITEKLPKLLFTLPESEFKNNLVELSISRIRTSRGGEYHIMQGGVWYFDD